MKARRERARAWRVSLVQAVALAAVLVTIPAVAAERRQSGTSADRAPARGSSAQLDGGSSADRYGGNSADRSGMAGNRDSRLDSTRERKSYGKADPDRRERRARKQREAAASGEGQDPDEGGGD